MVPVGLKLPKVAKDNLELMILLLLSPEYQNWSQVCPTTASLQISILSTYGLSVLPQLPACTSLPECKLQNGTDFCFELCS